MLKRFAKSASTWVVGLTVL